MSFTNLGLRCEMKRKGRTLGCDGLPYVVRVARCTLCANSIARRVQPVARAAKRLGVRACTHVPTRMHSHVCSRTCGRAVPCAPRREFVCSVFDACLRVHTVHAYVCEISRLGTCAMSRVGSCCRLARAWYLVLPARGMMPAC